MGKARHRKQTRLKRPNRTVLTNRVIGKWTLIVSVLTLISAVLIYYLAYEGPDLRCVCNPGPLRTATHVIDNQGNCLYYITLHKTLKNLSLKKGFLNDVQFSPVTTDTYAQFKLMSIDRTPIAWNEERSVEIKFGITFNKCDDLPSKFKMLLYYYDNLGNQIDRDVDDDLFPNDFEIESEPS